MTVLDVSKYSKVPFKEKGRDLLGWDCWGPPYVIYKEMLNIALPTYVESYPNTEDQKELGRLINNEKTTWKKVDHPEPFDIVIIRLKNEPMHCGLYIGDGKFIHCLTREGTCIEKLDSMIWRNRIVEFRRYSP